LLEIDKSAAPVIAVKGPLREWLHELKVSLRVGKLRRKNCDVYYWDKGKIVYRDKAILIVPEELRDAAWKLVISLGKYTRYPALSLTYSSC